MKFLGLDISINGKKPSGQVVIRSIQPGGKPISQIRRLQKIGALHYGQTFTSGRGHFISPEYDLSEIGKIEDSVSGHRLTAVKIDGEIKTLSFEQLWSWAEKKYSYYSGSDNSSKERIFIPENELLVLSGKFVKNLPESEAKEKRICRVVGCTGKYESRGMCETHRGEYRKLGYIKDKIEGSWESCRSLIRHKTNKKGFHFLQKYGSTETTEDHSLISLTEAGLQEFKPDQTLNIARIQEVDQTINQFGNLLKIDLSKFVDAKTEGPNLVDYTRNPRNKEKWIKRTFIPNYITGNQLCDFVALIGAFVSEGSTTEGGNKGFRIASSDKKWLEDLQTCFQRVFPKVSVSIVVTGKEMFALSCSHQIIARLFSNLCGCQSSNKKLPDFIYQLPREVVLVLNKYLLDGDGNRQSYGFSYTTKSLQLASQYSFLLRLMNINYSFNYKFKDDQIYYSIRTCKFFEQYKPCKTWLSPLKYQGEYVYDLEVPTTHNFIDLAGQVLLHNTDSFVRQSFKKKIGLMFKEGLGYKGANANTIRYIKVRMAQISRATGIPTVELIKRIGHSLIRTSNAYLVKVRDPKSSGGRAYKDANGKLLKPVAGYFPAAPETMKVDISKETGRVAGWKQTLPNGYFKYFNVEDVIHFHIDRREGFVFGIPTIIPVIDDIRALRQLEENIELLLYQNLFPLFHYKVGTETAPAGYDEDGNREVDVVENQIRLMPSEGAIVTPERHEIKAVGSEGRALRAEGYLEHFKKRVFAGLGVSSVDMGDGDTTNRATANTLSRQLIDTVKDVQDALESQWDHEVISELLMESTFGEDVLDEDSMVHLNFAEIDLLNKVDQEKHATELFKSQGITWDEYRGELSREPIRVPENGEDQDPSKWPDWFNTYWKLFEEPLNLIRSADEPYSMAAKQAAESRSMAATGVQLGASKEEKKEEIRTAAEEDRKTKVAVATTKSKEPSSKKDHFLSEAFDLFEVDTVSRLRSSLNSRGIVDHPYLLSLARVWADDTSEKLNSLAAAQMIRGFNDQTSFQASLAELHIELGRKAIKERISFRIDKLIKSTISLISKRVDSIPGDVKLSEVQSDYIGELHAAFDAVRFRIDFIWDVEIRKAYNYGRVLGLQFLNESAVELVSHIDSCERCKAMDGQVLEVNTLNIDNVVPHHPGCKCGMKLIRLEASSN